MTKWDFSLNTRLVQHLKDHQSNFYIKYYIINILHEKINNDFSKFRKKIATSVNMEKAGSLSVSPRWKLCMEYKEQLPRASEALMTFYKSKIIKTQRRQVVVSIWLWKESLPIRCKETFVVWQDCFSVSWYSNDYIPLRDALELGIKNGCKF